MTSMYSLVLLLGLIIVVTAKLHVPKIQKLKHQTQVLTEQNPRNGPACFATYIPILEGISSKYEVEYTSCLTDFNDQNALENSKWQGPRNKLEQSGQSACRAMIECSYVVGYVESFECYAHMGAEHSKTMYTMSADAAAVAVEIKEYYTVIETSKTICINNAERAYVEDTTKTYEQLNACLNSSPFPDDTTPYPGYTDRTTTTPKTSTTPRSTSYPKTPYTPTPARVPTSSPFA